MDAPLRSWRLSGAVCTGIALGIGAWIGILSFQPKVPNFRVLLHSLERPMLAGAASPIVGGGMDTPAQEIEARLLFVGDIMLDRNVAYRTRQSGNPNYPFQKLPAGWFDSFDYAVGNLEGPVTDRRRSPEKSIDFIFDPSVVPVLKAQGLDAFSQANNHALDQGAAGYEDSVRRLREAGLLVFGHQVLDGSLSLATTTVRGVRFAFVGYNTTDNPIDKTQAGPVIQQAAREVDFVIAFTHWGEEYKDRPQAGMIADAHWLVDQGADAVIGGHPHWAQGFSSYKGKPIAWSLGNFIFDQDWSVQTRQGLAVAFTVKGGKITLEPIPLNIDQSRPTLLQGEELIKRLQGLANISDEGLRDQIRAGKMEF
ncbi:CapA family protein [Patescibacteria group bacterium]|nr:CapA family protein [Patescibacteria group bacterium]